MLGESVPPKQPGSGHPELKVFLVVRRIELETRLVQAMTSDAKEREIRKYSKTESEHLRLRRTKIKLGDFKTLKTIGKGAFGEVGVCYWHFAWNHSKSASVGETCSEARHREGIRDEEPAKG